jgi:hypothetical protein
MRVERGRREDAMEYGEVIPNTKERTSRSQVVIQLLITVPSDNKRFSSLATSSHLIKYTRI